MRIFFSPPQEKGTASRLAKISNFRRFLKLATSKKLNPIVSTNKNQTLVEHFQALDMDVTEYSEAKRSAESFQKTKSELFTAFVKAGLGNWVKKPMEQDEFRLELQ